MNGEYRSWNWTGCCEEEKGRERGKDAVVCVYVLLFCKGFG